MKFRWKKNTRGLFSTCQVCFNENKTKNQTLLRGMASVNGTNSSPLPLLLRRALRLFKNQGYPPRAPIRSLGFREGIYQRTASSRGAAPGCAAPFTGPAGGWGGPPNRAEPLPGRQPPRFAFSLTQSEVFPLHRAGLALHLPPHSTAVL